jgi:hypothetical protein
MGTGQAIPSRQIFFGLFDFVRKIKEFPVAMPITLL